MTASGDRVEVAAALTRHEAAAVAVAAAADRLDGAACGKAVCGLVGCSGTP